MNKPKKLFVCIPTYNEAGNIKKVLDRIFHLEGDTDNDYELNVIVIDDNSPDGTGEIVEGYIVKNPGINVSIIHNENKSGLANAYKQGFRKAIEENAFAVIMMDADLSHDPATIPKFTEKLDNYDFIIGTRYSSGGDIKNWDKKRKFISKFGNIYSRIILGVNVSDLTGGYNCYKTDVLKNINLDSIRSCGYSFQIELKYRAVKEGYKYTEIPIIFRDRISGTSKFDSQIIFEAIFTPWRLKFRN